MKRAVINLTLLTHPRWVLTKVVGINQSYGSSLGTSKRFPNESSCFPSVKAAFHVAKALLCEGSKRQMFMAASVYTDSFKSRIHIFNLLRVKLINDSTNLLVGVFCIKIRCVSIQGFPAQERWDWHFSSLLPRWSSVVWLSGTLLAQRLAR